MRNRYLRNSENVSLLTTIDLNNPENNAFDKSFTPDTEIEEWDDWMRWESGVIDFEAHIFDPKKSINSSISSPGPWSADIEDVGNNPVSASLFAGNEFRFDDTPFELDQASQSCHGSLLGPASALFSPRVQTPQDVRRYFRGISTLTEAEERSLQNIAMPHRVLAKAKISSGSSSLTAIESSPSLSLSVEPDTRTRKNNKRKSLINDEVPIELCQSRQRGHNAIEKRYRTNLNNKIDCLRRGVPSVYSISSPESKSGDEDEKSDGEGIDSKTEQRKYGKAAILTRALEYIQHLENTTQRLGGEVDSLKTHVRAFEKLAMNGSVILNSNVGLASSDDISKKIETLESIQAGKSFVRAYQITKY